MNTRSRLDISEQELVKKSGGLAIVIALATITLGIILAALFRNIALGTVCGLCIIAGLILLAGLTSVAPGQARVVSLFGRYIGTLYTPGLSWVNPFTTRDRISVRIRNHETATLKVNDADGNPIEISAVVVWQIHDTAKALYATDAFDEFVHIQAETAVRHIATSHPYDARVQGKLSLRENSQEISAQLSAEVAERVASAGIHIIESRITRLSYAPEIAQTMLRRQQAEAVVAARSRIVEGAVGMVRQALESISEQGIVQLDEERKAAMVSNLLVVLCSEQSTQPVLNTGHN